MNSSNTLRNALTLLATFGGLASAATIVQTESYAFVPAGSQTLVFDKFDTLGGTHVSIPVIIQQSPTQRSGSRFVDNDHATGGTGTITQTNYSLTGRPIPDDGRVDLSSESPTAPPSHSASIGEGGYVRMATTGVPEPDVALVGGIGVLLLMRPRHR